MIKLLLCFLPNLKLKNKINAYKRPDLTKT